MTQLENLPKTQHLFLLIGGNPLPNYVAASLLLADKGHLYLVHSQRNDKAMKSGTFEIAKRVCKLLHDKFQKENRDFTHHYVDVEEADPDDVYSKIQSYAQNLRRASLGLNYTGGTKVMSVHAYRALRDNVASVVFTYLDAQSLCLIQEESNNNVNGKIFVRHYISLSIRTLTELHGEKLKSGSPTQVFYLGDCANGLIQVFAKDLSLLIQWNDWVKKIRQWKLPKAKKDPITQEYQNWDDEHILRTKQLAWPTDPHLQSISQLLQDQVGTDLATSKVDPQLILENVRQRAGMPSCSELCDWFDGFWLEHYVLNCIKTIAERKLVTGLHDCGRNLKTEQNPKRKDFEMDIGVMVGYQLFALSCTTSTQWQANKLKLFEAYIRGRQLGGEEARIGFVTLMEGAAKLQKEVAEQWQAGERIRIFDAREIANLTTVLADWFNKDARR